MPKILASTNRKGGVGKSTIAVGISQFLANQGFSVALIDLDTQSNLAVMLGCTPSADGVTNWLEGLSPNFRKVASGQKASPFDLLDGLDRTPEIREDTLHRLCQALPHDVVVLDCPPAEGILSIAATVIADVVVIPMETDAFSASGAEAVRHLIQPDRQPVLHVLNKFSATRSQDNWFRTNLISKGFEVMVVRADESLRNKASEGLGIPASGRASKDIWEIQKWVLERIQG